MGHDIDIINKNKNNKNRLVGTTYITGNFSKYSDKYPGIYAIHGHSNQTVIRILKKTLTKLLYDDIVPIVHNPGGRALTFGDPDPIKDLQCYAACLQEFLVAAIEIKNDCPEDNKNIYWFSDQVFKVEKYTEEDKSYESEGTSETKIDPDSDSDSD